MKNGKGDFQLVKCREKGQNMLFVSARRRFVGHRKFTALEARPL